MTPRSIGRTLAISLSTLLLAAAAANAQWISFSDETSSRLVLNAFADNPGGDPLADDQEKDVAGADLDQDGLTDLVVVRKRPFSNPGARQDALLMNENGVLVDRTSTLAPGFINNPTDARDVHIVDVDGDGWLDVIIANTFGQQSSLYRNAGSSGGNWLGLVDESFRLPTIAIPGDVPVLNLCALWAGDVTGDGAPDLFLSNYRPSGGTLDQLLINDGNGFFSNETTARLGNLANVAFGTSVEIYDMDGDGDQDIVKISTLYSVSPFPIGQFILWNDGNGFFTTFPFQTLAASQPYMFSVGDMNGDGLLDMFLQGDVQDRVAIAQSTVPNGPVSYTTTVLSNSPRTTGFGGNTKLADVDGDGDLDAGVAPIDVDIANCGNSSDFALLQNPGNGVVFDPWAANNDQNFHLDPHDFEFLDVNNDGCLDLFYGLCTGWRVFVQQGCAAGAVATIEGLRIRAGVLVARGAASLDASDDDYLGIQAVQAGAPFVTDFNIVASSPSTTVSSLSVTLESGATRNVAAGLLIFNYDTSTWTSLGGFTEMTSDTVKSFPNLANPNAFVRDSDGEIRLRYQSRTGSAYTVRLDLVRIDVTP